jgi:micrococcal nuclease
MADPVDGDIPAVYDGDTLTLVQDLGHHVWLDPLNYRLYGINAPELRGETHAAGLLAREYLRQLVRDYAIKKPLPPWLRSGFLFIVVTHQYKRYWDYRPAEDTEKFGRYLIEVIGQDANGALVNLNQKMIEAGHAVPYFP